MRSLMMPNIIQKITTLFRTNTTLCELITLPFMCAWTHAYNYIYIMFYLISWSVYKTKLNCWRRWHNTHSTVNIVTLAHWDCFVSLWPIKFDMCTNKYVLVVHIWHQRRRDDSINSLCMYILYGYYVYLVSVQTLLTIAWSIVFFVA